MAWHAAPATGQLKRKFVPKCAVMHRHGALNVHPMPGAMKARTLPIYCIYIYISMKTSESESSFCLRMCPPGTLRNSRALGYLDWSRLLSQIYENENGEFQIEARFQSKYIVSMRIATMLISSLSQHFDQIGSNWARIALINVSKLSDENVLPLDLNFVKLLFPLREWRQKLTSSMVQPKLCSTNTVENNHRHQHDIKHNASLSTRFLLYRSTKPKKGVRLTFNIYLYNASQSYTIQTMLINLRQSQLEEKQPSLPEQIIFWLHSSWYLFFCFRSPVHFRPSTLQRPATAEGQGHLKQCPKARRSINRRSLLSSFCNSLPTYLFF